MSKGLRRVYWGLPGGVLGGGKPVGYFNRIYTNPAVKLFWVGDISRIPKMRRLECALSAPPDVCWKESEDYFNQKVLFLKSLLFFKRLERD